MVGAKGRPVISTKRKPAGGGAVAVSVARVAEIVSQRVAECGQASESELGGRGGPEVGFSGLTVVGEDGLENLEALRDAAGGVQIRRERRAQVAHVDVAVLGAIGRVHEKLGVAELDGDARGHGRRQRQAHEAGEVLPEVHDVDAGRRRGDGDGLDLGLHGHGREGLRRHARGVRAARVRLEHGGRPRAARVGVRGKVPPERGLRLVPRAPVVHVVVLQRAGAAHPVAERGAGAAGAGAVGAPEARGRAGPGRDLAVAAAHAHLHARLAQLAVVVRERGDGPRAGEARRHELGRAQLRGVGVISRDRPDIGPPVAEHDGDGVRAAGHELRGDVVRVVEGRHLVRRPARVEARAAHARPLRGPVAVHAQVVVADGRDVDARLRDRDARREAEVELGAHLVHARPEGAADPGARRPLGLRQQARGEARRRGGRRRGAVAVRPGHGPRVDRVALQRGARVGDVRRGRGGDDAAVPHRGGGRRLLRHDDAVARLVDGAVRRRDEPAEARRRRVDEDGLRRGQVLREQVGGRRRRARRGGAGGGQEREEGAHCRGICGLERLVGEGICGLDSTSGRNPSVRSALQPTRPSA